MLKTRSDFAMCLPHAQMVHVAMRQAELYVGAVCGWRRKPPCGMQALLSGVWEETRIRGVCNAKALSQASMTTVAPVASEHRSVAHQVMALVEDKTPIALLSIRATRRRWNSTW